MQVLLLVFFFYYEKIIYSAWQIYCFRKVHISKSTLEALQGTYNVEPAGKRSSFLEENKIESFFVLSRSTVINLPNSTQQMKASNLQFPYSETICCTLFNISLDKLYVLNTQCFCPQESSSDILKDLPSDNSVEVSYIGSGSISSSGHEVLYGDDQHHMTMADNIEKAQTRKLPFTSKAVNMYSVSSDFRVQLDYVVFVAVGIKNRKRKRKFIKAPPTLAALFNGNYEERRKFGANDIFTTLGVKVI